MICIATVLAFLAQSPVVEPVCCAGQMLALILHRLPAECEMSEDLAEGLQEALLERLRDKLPGVRVQAIAALCRLADPGEVGLFMSSAASCCRDGCEVPILLPCFSAFQLCFCMHGASVQTGQICI